MAEVHEPAFTADSGGNQVVASLSYDDETEDLYGADIDNATGQSWELVISYYTGTPLKPVEYHRLVCPPVSQVSVTFPTPTRINLGAAGFGWSSI